MCSNFSWRRGGYSGACQISVVSPPAIARKSPFVVSWLNSSNHWLTICMVWVNHFETTLFPFIHILSTVGLHLLHVFDTSLYQFVHFTIFHPRWFAWTAGRPSVDILQGIDIISASFTILNFMTAVTLLIFSPYQFNIKHMNYKHIIFEECDLLMVNKLCHLII